jgi:hypothetical protein
MRGLVGLAGVVGVIAIASSVGAEEQFNPPAALQTPPTHQRIMLAPPPKAISADSAAESTAAIDSAAVDSASDDSTEAVRQLIAPSVQENSSTPINRSHSPAAASAQPQVCPAISSQAEKLGGTEPLDAFKKP